MNVSLDVFRAVIRNDKVYGADINTPGQCVGRYQKINFVVSFFTLKHVDDLGTLAFHVGGYFRDGVKAQLL